MNKDISCYSSRLIIEYCIKVLGFQEDLIFLGIEEYKNVLTNPLEWISAEIWISLSKNIVSLSNNKKEFLYQVGEELTRKQTSNFALLFLRIAPLNILLNKISSHIQKTVNTNLFVKGSIIRPGVIDAFFAPKDVKKYSEYICDFNRGCTFATIALKGYKNVKISEIACAARSNASACHYRLTWDPEPPLFQKIRTFFYFRFRDQTSIINHMEEAHQTLEAQHKEILALKDFYSHIMTNMSEGIIWLNLEEKIIYSNQGFTLISGMTESEISGKEFISLLKPNVETTFTKDIFSKCKESPSVPLSIEITIPNKDGKDRIGQASIAWIPSEHRDPGYIITIRDITEKRKIEKKLWAAQERYQKLYQYSPALILGIDLKGYLIFINPAMAEQSGYSQDELRGMHFSELIAPDGKFNIQSLFSGRLDSGIRMQEVHFRAKNGDWKSSVLSTFPLLDDEGKAEGVGCVGLDVTETKRLNEMLVQSQRLEVLGRMAAGMAHDFNNVLAGITGHADLILRKNSNEKLVSSINAITRAGIRGKELVDGLRKFSKKDKSEFRTINLVDTVKESGEFVVAMISKCIELTCETPDRDVLIMGDAGNIHQCILNLCINARDAIGEEIGKLSIRLNTTEDRAYVEVEDTGGGIPPDIIEKIFEPFFTTKKDKGTGLGLAVVYGIMKSHNGRVTVSTRPGEGTIFKLEFPILDAKSLPDAYKKTIVVVDHNELVRNFCMEVFREVRVPNQIFETGESALSWSKDHLSEISAVLVDPLLSGQGGLKTAQLFSELKNEMKIIWIVSSDLPDNVQQNLNGHRVIRKPFTPVNFIKTIEEELQEKLYHW